MVDRLREVTRKTTKAAEEARVRHAGWGFQMGDIIESSGNNGSSAGDLL
jgi:hypothetical protein